jgi:hypothetical protein
MRLIHHVLIKHGVRIAQKESGLRLVPRLKHLLLIITSSPTVTFLLNRLTGGSEEHAVQSNAGVVIDRELKFVPLESLAQDVAHLLGASEERLEAQVKTRGATTPTEATAVQWVVRYLTALIKLLDVHHKLIDFFIVILMHHRHHPVN